MFIDEFYATTSTVTTDIPVGESNNIMHTYFLKVHLDQYKKDTDHPDNNDIEIEYADIDYPTRATTSSAGYDFYMPFDLDMKPGYAYTIPTGYRVHMKPNQFLMLIPRSGLGFKYGFKLQNTCGIVDSDYFFADNEGHIMAKVSCDKPVSLKAGDRFMQGIFLTYDVCTDDVVAPSHDRKGGFGSTGN